MELAQVAGVDSRALVFLVILGPALGWVAFNILQPGLNQLNDMQVKNAKGKKSVPLGLGLSAAALLGMPEQADAATELMQTALDARIVIFGAFVPVLGWVAYNILGPGLNQLEDMQKAAAKKKGVAAGVGLSAAALLGMPEQADAATELMQTALDARIVIFGAFVPVLGWVAYNILGPGLNQLEDMQKAAAKKKGVAAGVGLSAAALLGMPEQADAATELMQTALDARIVIFGAFVPVLGWVAYNILGPGLNQLEDMQKAAAKKKGVAAGVGLSAAALLGMPEQADAATELMQTALDARIVIFGAFVPVLGWVAYNILGPGLNQLEDMQKAAAKKKGVAAGVGLSAAALLGMPEQADAATELMQTALDARIVIFGAFVPVLGWVAYNILGPGLNQLEDMQKAAAKKKGVAAGVGLSAAALLGMPEQADAATELMQTALDARIVIFGAFVPVLGWVAYNILGPGLNQLEDMQKAAAKKK